MPKIIFTDIKHPKGAFEKPKPASEYIPEWYKHAKSYLSPNGKKVPSLDRSIPGNTIKRCMPLWDMMVAGYIIETPYDIYVHRMEDGSPYFQWGINDAIAFQPIEQVQNHPWFDGEKAGVRIVHPWSIKTPKGWSILIMQPQHREPTPIEIIAGIVDTDDYSPPFNMFIKLRDPNFEGLIPKGTPFAQIIPFKREKWSSELGGEKEIAKYNSDVSKFFTVIFDRYKKFFWQRKEYR
jgi:hypothetical protein